MSDTLDPNAQPGLFGVNGQGLAGAIMAPQTQALLGLASGLAQAAMPRPYRVPLGAAIAMGAAGAGQGLQQSQQLQHGALDNQSQALNLQLQQARQPLFQQMIRQQLGMAGGSVVPPFGVPAPPGQQPGTGRMPTGGAPAGGGGAGAGVVATPASLLGQVQFYSALGQPAIASEMVKGAMGMGGAGNEPLANGGVTYTPGGPTGPAVIARTKTIEANASAGGNLLGQGYTRLADGSIGIIKGGPADPAVKNAQTAGENLGRNGMRLASDGSAVPLAGYQGGISANAAAQSGGDSAGRSPYQPPITYQAAGPDGVVRSYTIPVQQYASGGNAPAGVMSGATFTQKVAAAESGGNPNATNPSSSAGGAQQLTDPTFASYMRAVHPQLLAQVGPQGLAELKAIPGLSQDATVWNARQNAGVLATNGLPVNANTLGLAHSVGGSGAVRVLSAPASTPLAQVLSPQAMQANPQYANMTAGQLRANQVLRYGTQPVDLSMSGTGGPAAPSNAVASGSQGPLGGVAGAPAMTPEQQGISEGYGAVAKQVTADAAAAPGHIANLQVLQNAASIFRPGASADTRLSLSKTMSDAFQSIGITAPASWTDKAAAGETIGKVGTRLGFELARSLGTREALGVVQMAVNNNPNIKMSEGGYGVILNSLMQAEQMKQDMSRFQESWLQTHASTAGMQDAFTRQFPPEAYASRVMPFALPADKSAWQSNVIYTLPNGSTAKRVPGGFVVAN